jgi:DNA repair exonuclease SbcCD nuclease subunit
MVTIGKRVDIMALHQPLTELCGMATDLSAMDVAIRLSKLGTRYVALGDIHMYKEVEIGGVRFVYPGTIEMNASDEPQDKSISIIEISPTEMHTSVQFVPIRRFIEFYITKDKVDTSLEELITLLGAGGDPLVFVYYDSVCKDMATKAEGILKERGLMHRLAPLSSGSASLSAQLNKQAFERKGALGNLKDAVASYFDSTSDEYQLVFRLLDNPDRVRELIAAYFAEKGLTL